MTGTVAYILAKKLITSASSGISGIEISDGSLVFHLADGGTLSVPMPEVNESLKFVDVLPQEGVEDTLYIVGNTINYWTNGEYITITGSGVSWETI